MLLRQSRRIESEELDQAIPKPKRVVAPATHVEKRIIDGVPPVAPSHIVVPQGGEELHSTAEQGPVGFHKFLHIAAAAPVLVDLVSQHQDKIEPAFAVTIQHLAGNSILWISPRSAVSDQPETELAVLSFLNYADTGKSSSPPGQHGC